MTATPPQAVAVADDDDDDPPIRKRTSTPPAPSDPVEPALAPGQRGVIVRDETGKVVAAMPYGPTLEDRRAEVQRALEPLMKDAVADYEKAAARRATDVALAAVETRSVAEAIKTALDMYAADVDRAGADQRPASSTRGALRN